jgi:hypothetical protein
MLHKSITSFFKPLPRTLPFTHTTATMHPPPPRIYASATRESKTNTITSPLSRSFSPPSFPPPSPSLSPPSLLTYNIRSLSFYSTDPQSLTRRLSISHAIKDFIKSHDIICLQETHLAHLESFALSSLSGCVVSRNNLSMSSAGTLIIDTPAILRNYQPVDVALPAFAKGHVQLRRYTPTSPHSQPFQVFNAYFKSGGDFGFNHRLLEAMLTIDNDIDTYLCGDLNFLESPDDTTSASPLMPPASFAAAWSNFKLKFNLFDLPSDTHTFFHLTSNPLSPYSWSSRLDHILFPAYLASHPIITPSTTIPHHSTNLNVSPLNSRSSFSDHLPLHLTYSASTAPPTQTSPAIPTWLASSTEFATNLRDIWLARPQKGKAFKTLAAYKRALFSAANVTRRKKLATLSAPLLLSQHLSLLRLILTPQQDLTRISYLCSLNPLLSHLISFSDGKWLDNGLLVAIQNLRIAASPSPPLPVHPIRAMADSAPSTRTRIGPLRIDASQPECSSDDERSDLAASYWSNIWKKRDAPPPDAHLAPFLANYKKKVKLPLCVSPSLDDISSAIRNSNNSTPGPDGVSFAAWRAAPDLAAPVLLAVFRALSNGQPPPRGFNLGLLFLLPKKHTGLISDTRPLSVTNTDNRILAAATARAIMPAVLDLVDPCQKGFLVGKNGSDHILDINTLFFEAVEKKQEQLLFLLDTAKAFDSIDHSWIHRVLKVAGFPRWLRLFVKAALTEVKVTPFFGTRTKVWIDIDRGVKQGCPLSPLLFLIAYDPLLSALSPLPHLRLFAFADDLAIATRNVLSIYPALSCLSLFSTLSGLGINKDKSLVLSASDPSTHAAIRSGLLESPWPDLPLKTRGTHLGVIIGRDVTLDEIWSTPYKKALERIRIARPFVKSLSFANRITYANVFIISIFSYIGQYFVLPSDLWKPLVRAISLLIIPFHGGAFSYDSLVCSNLMFGSRPFLKDVWTYNISLLASRSCLIETDSNYNNLPYVDLSSTKLINHHRDAAAVDFWRSRHLPDGTLVPPPKTSSSAIYNIILADVFLSKASAHLANKVSAFAGMPRTIAPSTTLASISSSLLSSSPPPFLLGHHFSLMNNALATSRRMRHQNRLGVDQIPCCHFCGTGQDSLVHLLSVCIVVSTSRSRFFSSLSLDPLLVSPPPPPLPPWLTWLWWAVWSIRYRPPPLPCPMS